MKIHVRVIVLAVYGLLLILQHVYFFRSK